MIAKVLVLFAIFAKETEQHLDVVEQQTSVDWPSRDNDDCGIAIICPSAFFYFLCLNGSLEKCDFDNISCLTALRDNGLVQR